MKPSPISAKRRRWLLVGGLLLTLWASWQVSKEPAAPKVVAERNVRRNTSAPKPPASAPALPLVWPARTPAQPQAIVDLFSPPLPPKPAPSAPVPADPTTPVFSQKYIGHLQDGANSQAFMADAQDRVTTVKPGQALDNDWTLITLTATQLVFRHSATGQEHTLQIGLAP